MADIAITPASVVPGAGAAINFERFAGEALAQGDAVYRKAADNKWWKGQNDGVAEEATVSGIALTAASAGQPVAVQTGGRLAIGGTVAPGIPYFVSATAGKICPLADVTSGRYSSLVCYGVSTTDVIVNPLVTGVTV